MMKHNYTLAGDRGVEYQWAKDRVKAGTGTALDVGCGQKAHMSKHAVQKGYTVVGIDLCPVTYKHNKFTLVQADLLKHDFEGAKFDLILNVSSIEHFGLKGRYGINRMSTTADLRGMKVLKGLMTPDSVMILTVPLGHDLVAAPYHRVYGRERLPKLLKGFTIIDQQYWAKFDGVDKFKGTTQGVALNTEPIIGPPNYYAIGGFVVMLDG